MSSFNINADQELPQPMKMDLSQCTTSKRDFSTWRSLRAELSPIVQTDGRDRTPCLDLSAEKLPDESADQNSGGNASSKSKEISGRFDPSEKSSIDPERNLEAEGLGGLSAEANSKWEHQLKNLGGLAQILKRIQEMSLNEGLKQFGLDPKEWRLQRLARDVYRVEHVQDEGFSFVGKVQGTVLKPLKWKSLTLEAI
ncbi:MAG: hypothetical protein WCH11_00495 [Bdellovibrio sp.]